MPQWLDDVQGWLQDNLSVKAAENALDKGDQYFDNPTGSLPSLGWKLGTAPLRAGVNAIGTVGEGIGEAAGLVGASTSEAAREDPNFLDNADLNKIVVEDAGGAGREAIKKNLNALDLAGMLGGPIGDVLAANKLATAAKVAHGVDLASSVIDAPLGVNDMYEGVKKGDWARAGMGAFRTFGNVAGGLDSAGKLKGLSKAGDVANEVAHASENAGTQITAERDAHLSTVRDLNERINTMGDPDGSLAVQLDKARTAARAADLDLRRMALTPETAAENMRKLSDPRSPEVRGVTDAPMPIEKLPEGMETSTNRSTGLKERIEWVDVERDASGAQYSVEKRQVINPKTNKPYDRTPMEEAAKLWDSDEGFRAASAGLVDYGRQVEKAAEDLIPDMEDTLYSIAAHGGTKDVANVAEFRANLKARFGRLRGIMLDDSARNGMTYMPKPKAMARGAKARLPGVGNPVMISPLSLVHNINDRVDRLFKLDLTGRSQLPHMTDEQFNTAIAQLTPELQGQMGIAREMLKKTGQVPADLMNNIKDQMFHRDFTYTILHEIVGHNPETANHTTKRITSEDYQQFAGNDPRNPGMTSNLIPITGKSDVFSSMHNQIVRNMDHLEGNPAMMRLLQNPELAASMGQWRRKLTSVDEQVNNAFSEAKRARAGRVQNRTGLNDMIQQFDELPEDAAANNTAKALIDENEIGKPFASTTPPPDGPPMPPSDSPFGPSLNPLADRLKAAFLRQTKVNVENKARNADFHRTKSAALDAVEGEYAAGNLTSAQYAKAVGEIEAGGHGLIDRVAAMPITEEEKAGLVQQIRSQFEASAMERKNMQMSLTKLQEGGRLTPGEVDNLRSTLLKKIAEADDSSFLSKVMQGGEKFLGGFRATMSSLDLSAAGRQGLFAAVANPKETARAFKAQIDALKMTPQEFEHFMKSLRDPANNPFVDVADAAGLHMTSAHSAGPSAEEFYQNASWAEKIPGVRRTEQAYIAYLNKMRVELFNKYARQLMESGVDVAKEDGTLSQEYKDVAYMVNTLTGRGEMSLLHVSPNSRMRTAKVGQKLFGTGGEEYRGGEKTLEGMTRALSTVMFAPRFTASRAAIVRDSALAVLGGNLDPKVQKMYMKNLYGTYAAATAVAAFAAQTGIGTFQMDPRKADFGVLKVHNTRYDLYGGTKQWAKLFATLASDKYFSKTYGIKEYGTKGAKTKTGEVGKFVQGKLSPATGFLMQALTGEDFLGRKSNMLMNAYGHTIPLIIQNAVEVAAAGDADQLAVAVPLAGLGVGVNAYSNNRQGSWSR